MNFYFGHIHTLSRDQARQHQMEWLNKTIFPEYKDCISRHVEDGFSLTLVNDPKDICPYQSNSILVNDDFVCATDCQLFNKVELATELDIDPKSQNEVFFISAFLKWGSEFPNKFDGRFSFVIWDRNHKSLLAGLDHLGYGNFSYSHVNHDTYFSSDLATLLDQPKVDKSINMKRFYQCFRYSNNSPEQTYFKYCYYCPPSHVIKINHDQIETTDYWKISKKTPSKNKTGETAFTEEFIYTLARALDKEIGKDKKSGLMLSGGYDSSLLAAILAESKSHKNNLTCYSYTFEKFNSCDESKYIKQTLIQLGLDGKLINCDDKTVLADIDTRQVTKEVINVDSFSSLPEAVYKQASLGEIDIIISGLNGDDLFGGVRYMYADLLSQKEFLSICKNLFNSKTKFTEIKKLVNFGFRPLLPKILKNTYRLFFKQAETDNPFKVLLSSVNNIDNASPIKGCKLFHHQNLLKLIYYRNIPESLFFLRKHLYLTHNLNISLPYYNKQMLELIWSIPLSLLEANGRMRGLQITALNRYRLNHIVNRTDKTNFQELIETGIVQHQQRIRQLANSSLLIKSGMVQADQVQELINKIGKSKQAFALRFFVLVELWYRKLANDPVTRKIGTNMITQEKSYNNQI